MQKKNHLRKIRKLLTLESKLESVTEKVESDTKFKALQETTGKEKEHQKELNEKDNEISKIKQRKRISRNLSRVA